MAATIESLSAQLRAARWEKAIAEQRADTLTHALSAKQICCSSEVSSYTPYMQSSYHN